MVRKQRWLQIKRSLVQFPLSRYFVQRTCRSKFVWWQATQKKSRAKSVIFCFNRIILGQSRNKQHSDNPPPLRRHHNFMNIRRAVTYQKVVWTEDLESWDHFVFEKIWSSGLNGQFLGLPDRDGGRGVEVQEQWVRLFLELGRLRDVNVTLVLKNALNLSGILNDTKKT